jgi:hypothetical protein
MKFLLNLLLILILALTFTNGKYLILKLKKKEFYNNFSILFKAHYKQLGAKIGVCPKADSSAVRCMQPSESLNECKVDKDCGKKMKCCPNACSVLTCQSKFSFMVIMIKK